MALYRSLLILLCLVCSGPSQAAVLDLKISQTRVVIMAEEVDLKEILQAISLETGMQISYFTSKTSEEITCRIDEASMADSLASLLKNWNYSLVFGENREGLMIPQSLWLVGKVSNKSHAASLHTSAETNGYQDDHIKHLQKNVFAELFKNGQIRVKKMKIETADRTAAQPGNAPVHLLPGQTGIQITSLAPDSPFTKIGLHTGDIIYDVNGTPVNSAKDLANAMKVTDNQSIIRIERYKADQTIDPIYIELH